MRSMFAFFGLGLAAVASTGLDALPAQGGITWTRAIASGSPPPRAGHFTAWDPAGQRIVLFGGVDSRSTRRSDTWTWDGVSWSRATPTRSPSARGAHGMATDTARRRVVLFGGIDAYGMAADTWEWNGTDWIDTTPTVSPSPRIGHALSFDGRGVLLFGGGGSSGPLLSDTWRWNGTDWTRLSPHHRPPQRYGHVMAFDAGRGRVVLFGGIWPRVGTNGWLQDTWEWDGTDWIRVRPTHSPPPRADHAMTYDATRQRVVWVAIGPGGELETLEWDGVNWRRPSLTAGAPPPRSGHTLAFDEVRGRALLFGGGDGSGTLLGDTWEAGSTTPADFRTFGAGCAGTGVPILDAAPYSAPWIGDSFRAHLRNLPQGSFPILVWGLSNRAWNGRPLPIELSGIGLPGCWQRISADGFSPLRRVGHTAPWSLTVPPDPALVGGSLYFQGVVLGGGGPPPLGATLSNGGGATFGMR